MNLEELEKLRKDARNKVLFGILITLVVAVILFITFPVGGVFALVIGGIITFFISKKAIRKFTLGFKDAYVLKSLEGIFDDLDYKPELGISRETIASTEMMHMGDTYSSNDYIHAKYKDVDFVQADVHIQEERQTRDSNGNTTTHYVTLFKGRWMIFDFNKEFRANIQVRQKGFGNAKVNNWFKKKEEKYKKVQLEDVEFNKDYKVFAQSQHEAFYVLTPSLMNRIKTLNSGLKGKVLLCFVNNKLHVGLQNNKDSFEHSIFKKINEQQVIELISSDIKVITSFVDELNLDNDLFKI